MVLSSWEGLIEKDEIKKTSVSKKKEIHEQSIPKGQEQYYMNKGWEIERENKTTLRIKKIKSHDEAFEDITWYALSRMGFDLMNSNRNFRIPVADDTVVNPFQIDIFAADENVVIVVECKSSENPERRSMKNDIVKIIGIKENATKQIKKYISRDVKVGFVLATNNITMSKEDLEYAKSNNICIINEYDLEYYESLTDNLGKASKYQFLSDVFENREIPNLQIEIPAIRGRMGGDVFYSFVIEPSKLLPIAYVSHRTKNAKNNDKAYQRMIKKKRLEAITEYINKNNGLFPNSIILNIHSGKNLMEFKPTSKGATETSASLGHLSLPNRFKSAWVIDGQHRLYGFANTDVASKVTIPVIAFENLKIERQAEMFININSKQVKVPTNLLEELHADLHWNSNNEEERMAALISKIVIDLSREKTSPLFNMVKFADDRGHEKPVTITSLTAALKKTKLLGTVEKGGLIKGPLHGGDMEGSLDRATYVLSEFFSLFAKKAKENWNLGSKEGGYLCTSNAVTSEIIVMAEIMKHIHKTQGIHPAELKKEDISEQILIYAEPIASFFATAGPGIIKDYRRQLGGQGQQDSAYAMMKIIKDVHNEFTPIGLEKYLKDRESKWNEKATIIVKDIQMLISKNIMSSLKKNFGDQWWRQGVPEEIRTAAASAREKDENPSDLETYFVLIDYRKIIAKNWEMFKEKYGFGKSSKKDDKLSWFQDLNTIRNKVSHPERGLVTEEEYKFLTKIQEELFRRTVDL
jgi:DNA sulfur modification protein DndB